MGHPAREVTATRYRGRARLIAAAGTALLALSLVACGGSSQPAAQDKDSGPQPVRLGIVTGGAVALYPQVAAGQMAGLFEKNGVDLKRTETSTSGDAATLLITGNVDIATVTPDVAVQAIAKNAKLVILSSSADQSPWYLETKNALADPTAFKGKRLGVPQLTGTATFLAKAGLERAGLSAGQYELIVTGKASQRLIALTKGAVDGTILPAPVNFTAESKGFQQLMYLGDVIKAPGSVFVATREFVEQHRDATVAFLRATLEARDWLYDPANKEKFLSTVATYPEGKGASADALAKTYEEFVVTRKIHPSVGTVDLTELVAKMVQFGELKSSVDTSASVDNSLVQDAAKKKK